MKTRQEGLNTVVVSPIKLSARTRKLKLVANSIGVLVPLLFVFLELGAHGQAGPARVDPKRSSQNKGKAPTIPDEDFQELMRWSHGTMGLKEKLSQEDSIKSYEEDIRRTPTDSFAWWALGNGYRNERRFSDAIKAHEEALRLKPDDMDYWWALAMDYKEGQRPEDQLRVLARIIELELKAHLAWSARGEAFALLGQNQEAIKAFQEALWIQPHHIDAWLSLGNAYRATKQREQARKAYQEAINYAHEDIREYPDDDVAWQMLGEAYSALGNRAKVLEVYKRLKAISPGRAEYFFQEHVLPQ